MRCSALNLVVSNDTRTTRRGRSVRWTMGPSIDGGSRIRPPMPHQFVRKYPAPRVKVTRPANKILRRRPRSPAQHAPPHYRRPLKTDNIVQTSTPVFDGLWRRCPRWHAVPRDFAHPTELLTQ